MQWRHIEMARKLLASEQGASVRDWGGRLPIVLAYPNSYAVGMSSLATHSLYRWLNDLPGLTCERAFSWLGRNRFPRDPPITVESQRPISDAAVIAFSVSFELDYFGVVDMLRRAQVPLEAGDRDEGDPLVLLGGPAVSANPEPMALLADAIVIGEAEPLLDDLGDVLRSAWSEDRAGVLAALHRLPGVYVPSLHRGGRIARRWLANLDDYATESSLVAPRAQFGDMHLIEIARGCGRGCRFCLAGYWYRPPRERGIESVLASAREGLKRRRTVGLVASAVSDYAEIDALVAGLRQMDAAISVSSLRVRPLSEALVRALAETGSRSLTLAPEAGSERMRQVINKCVTHEDIVSATELAASSGFESLKLYFMLGLPGEREDDVEETVRLVGELKRLFPRHLVVNVTPFVPKAHTPYEREAMLSKPELDARISRLREGLSPMGVEFRSEGVGDSRMQGVLSRGDRRVGKVLMSMARPTLGRFESALTEHGLDADHYLGEWLPDRALPWGLVESGIRADFLRSERDRSARRDGTPPCDVGSCDRCGVCRGE